MKRLFALAISFALLAGPAVAADRTLALTIDGRPLSRSGPVALVHDGIAYANAIELVRAYGGIVSIAKGSLRATLRTHTASFARGSSIAIVDGSKLAMPGPALREDGTIYVPLAFFVMKVSGGRVNVDLDAHTARITLAAEPLPTLSP